MSLRSATVVRRDISIAARVTTLARNLRPKAPGSTPGRQVSPRVGPTTRRDDLQQLVLGPDHTGIGQLDHLMTRQPTDRPLSTGQLPPALAAPHRPMLDDQV